MHEHATRVPDPRFALPPLGMNAQSLLQSAHVKHYSAALVMPRHQHREASLCLVVNGSYAQRTRGRDEVHQVGHLMFCPGNEPHEQTFAQSGALKIHLAPGPQLLDVLAHRVALDDAPFTCAEALVDIARRMAAELLDPDGSSPIVVEGLALHAIDLFGRAETADAHAAWLHAARDYVESRALETFSLADVALAVDRHPIHVAREFKRAYQCTIGDYVRQVRLRTAAALLRSGRKSLADIASLSGFYDQAHLTRAFRTAHGMPPGRYRRRARTADANPVQSF
jgi:AraC family transcriptional regulator